MRIKIPFVTIVAIAVLMIAGCSSSDDGSSDTTSADPGGGSDTAVSILNFLFEPGDVTISVGDSVTWTNDASAAHTSTATDGTWNSQLTSGQSMTQTFDAAGTFDYFCSIHPSMTGTVTVNG